jgi:hypothetical protein
MCHELNDRSVTVKIRTGMYHVSCVMYYIYVILSSTTRYNTLIIYLYILGWSTNLPTSHKLIPKLQNMANESRIRENKGHLAAIMMHGRSRQQRYSKLADWEYIKTCALTQDPTIPLIPILGTYVYIYTFLFYFFL